MITRHFYRFDEVRAALLYAIMRGRPLETAFWVQELIDTTLYREVWATLVEAWLWFSLATDPNWICDIRLGSDASHLHLAAYRLCTNPKDNSLWATLLTDLQPDTLCANVPSVLPYSQPCLERYLSLALFQRKGVAAIWAAQRLTGDVQRLLPDSSRIVPSVLVACGLEGAVSLSAQILFICSRTEGRPTIALPTEIAAAVHHWSALKGRRSRRVFAVPKECLYGLTERGRGIDTIAEYRRLDDRIREETTGFWPMALAPYRQGDPDEALEAFYAAFFPDDIPDEWSAEEAAKSHGIGLGSADSSLQKIGSLWFQAESRFVWGFYEWPADRPPLQGSDFHHAARHLNADHGDTVAALLDPVRKLLIVE
jgi:hypothetical protein